MELAKKFAAGERFSAIADEWTSIRNRRYMNICIKGIVQPFELGGETRLIRSAVKY
jgi:hypothetical protein